MACLPDKRANRAHALNPYHSRVQPTSSSALRLSPTTGPPRRQPIWSDHLGKIVGWRRPRLSADAAFPRRTPTTDQLTLPAVSWEAGSRPSASVGRRICALRTF
jgi:hypothetical protein